MVISVPDIFKSVALKEFLNMVKLFETNRKPLNVENLETVPLKQYRGDFRKQKLKEKTTKKKKRKG